MQPLAATIAVLRKDPGISELTGDWIYAPRLPRHPRTGKVEDRIAQAMPRPCLVVQRAGGGSLGPGARSYLDWRVLRLNVFSYGTTPYDADLLDAKVYDFLTNMEQQVEGDTILRDAVASGGPTDLVDPDTSWPYVLSVFDLSASPNTEVPFVPNDLSNLYAPDREREVE